MKETSYTIRVPINIWAKLKALATLEDLTINNLIVEILAEKLEKDYPEIKK